MLDPQFTDKAVSRKKFNREIREFRSLSDQYCQRGWFLAYAKYPHVLVALATAKTNPVSIMTGVFFDYTNYDAAPPSVRLVHPITGVPYQNSELPTNLPRSISEPELQSIPNAALQIQQVQTQALIQAHGPDGTPFICLPGVREYHEHPAHDGDHWELHRSSGAGRLVRLLEIISKYGPDTIIGFNVQMIPNIGFRVFDVPPL
ncbi:MAG: hypothetical protein OXC42_08605 [Gammaproteobacteria bacterium]|nr:hypothetical protein [Gammaproteobacteria bacterium]